MSIQRISTGIPNLDELVEGSFPSEGMILLAGLPGSGKTILSTQFMYSSATKYGARGVYVCFAETKDDFLRNALRFGWDFERLDKEKRVAVLDLAVTREAGLQSNLDTIMETMTSLQAKRLVIDPFSAISMALKEPIDIRVMAHLLYKFLKKAQCVAILVSEQHWGSIAIGDGVTEFLADGVIHLETYFDMNNALRRRLRILKMRGTNHTKIPHEYEIRDDGFKILKAEKVATRRIKKSTVEEKSISPQQQ